MATLSPLLSFRSVLALVLLAVVPCAVAAQGRSAKSRQLRQLEPVHSWPSKPKRWALVIGVDHYADTQITTLGGASNDASSLAEALVRYAGFPPDQVTLLASDQPAERQPTRGNILRRLSNFAAVVPQDGLLLVSFAGHGMERGGQAFLLPADAQVSNDIRLLEDTAINVTRMKEGIREARVGQVVLILDACRNDPVGRSDTDNPLTTAYTRGFNFDVRNREVTAFATLYATAVGHRAYEYKEKRRGYFSWELIEGLKGSAANEKGEVTLASLVKYLQERVPKHVLRDLGVGKEQRPFAEIGGYRADELVIAIVPGVLKPAAVDERPVTRKVDSGAFELSYWETIKNSTDPEDFKSYLANYPNGQFADLARRRADVSSRASTPSGTNSAAAHIENGNKFRKESQWSKAEIEYRLALRSDPQNPELHGYLGFVLGGKAKFTEAETELREAIRLEPNRAEWHSYLGQALGEQKRYEEAEVEQRLAVRLEPDSCERHGRLGLILRAKKKQSEAEAELTEAARLCEDAVRREPNNAELLAKLARTLREQGKLAEAEIQYRSALRLQPDNALYHRNLGAVLIAQKKYAEAEAEHRKAVRLAPDTAWYHGGLGNTFELQEKFEEATAEYREAMRLEPGGPFYPFRLGSVLLSQKKFAEAEAQYREAVRLQPNNAEYRNELGVALDRQERWVDAEREFREAVRLERDNALYHDNLGLALLEQRKWPEAEAEFREAVRLEPKETGYHDNLQRAIKKQ